MTEEEELKKMLRTWLEHYKESITMAHEIKKRWPTLTNDDRETIAWDMISELEEIFDEEEAKYLRQILEINFGFRFPKGEGK